MDERFKRPDVYFEDEGRRLFPNGTILYTNGTEETGLVFWGAMDPWYVDPVIPKIYSLFHTAGGKLGQAAVRERAQYYHFMALRVYQLMGGGENRV
jgi:hypothetical protein